MHAIKLKTMIDRTHRLQVDLPADTPEGEAEVIVLLSTAQPSAADGPRSADAVPMDTLRAFLHDLDSRPLAHPRSAADIEAQIAETRTSWE